MSRFVPQVRASLAGMLLALAGAPLCAATADEAIATLQAAYMRAVQPGEQADLHRDLFATIVQRVQRSHAREVDFDSFTQAALKALDAVEPGTGEPAAVFKQAANGALRSLDAHSRYIDPQAHGSEAAESSGFGGVGLEVEPRSDGIGVLAPMPGTPAARAGLRAGDLIVRVDDQPMIGVALSDAVARMRGPPGTAVSITVRRADDEFTVSLTRETIRRALLRWALEGDVLVLKLASFSGAVTTALENAVREASAAGTPSAVVLDLRGNPGGLLREAVTVADAFLSGGEIVSVRGRTAGNTRSWTANAHEVLPGVPMVVLVDGRSASASEIVAAALQDNGRAKVIGQRSFGKGTVQTTFTLGERKGALKLTTSLFYSPAGREMQRHGVTPDIQLATPAKEEGGPAEGGALAGVRIDSAMCTVLPAVPDAALSCAVAYLRAGSVDAFMALFGPAAP